MAIAAGRHPVRHPAMLGNLDETAGLGVGTARAHAARMQTGDTRETSGADRFGPAYTWCDSRCERCPLKPHCPLTRALESSRWLGFATDAAPELARGTLHWPSQDGLSETELSLAALTLREAGIAYTVAIGKLTEPLLGAGAGIAEAARAARSSGMRIGPKVARLAGSVDERGRLRVDPWAWPGSVYATLLLIEHELGEARKALSRLPPLGGEAYAVFERARTELEEQLAPLFRRVPESARRELDWLSATGRAPSPFAVTR